MTSIEEIKNRLDTDNLSVLNRCDAFLDQRMEMERQRGDSAERRANIILSTVGAASAFLAFLASNIFSIGGEAKGLMIFIYAALVIWLARAVWYSLKSIRVQSRFRFEAESIIEFQGKSEIQAVKEIIAGKFWEYEHYVQPNSERLFYVQRAQRALVVLVGLLLFLGLNIILINRTAEYERCMMIILSVVLLLLLLLGDRMMEKKIWKHG